jgi:23S rRNA (uracil1939-C5)-methyltransferase
MAVDAEVFIQVNREGNRGLVRELLAWGEFNPRDRGLELYCGAGNFTLPAARRVKEIVAVEGDPRAIDNGRINAQANGLGNIRWIRAHAPRAAAQLREKGATFSKIILNPPRSGATGLERDLAALGAQKILYVSCNPATLARDLAALEKKGYRTLRVRPVDLFPHTFHVETLAEIALR